MKSFRHYFDEAAKKSLSRLHTHIENGHMVGILSASRANLSPKENNQRTKQLKDSLRKHGYTPVAVSGEYVEDHNGERVPVREKSFMIHSGQPVQWSSNPNAGHAIFLKNLKKHGEMFGQDTVLSVSKKHGSVFHGTGESTWVPKGKRTRIGGAGIQAGASVERSDFKSRLAGRPFLMGKETGRLQESIVKRGDSWVVMDAAKEKVLGRHDSEKKAKKQLAAIEISKARRK